MDEAEKRERLAYERKRAAIRAAKRKKRRREMQIRVVLVIFVAVIIFITGREIKRVIAKRNIEPTAEEVVVSEKKVQEPPEYDVQLLTVNPYSRPGISLEKVNGIVIHYTANPGTTAQQNRDYFEGLSLSGETYASSHFVIGLEGELIQCIPCSEIAYASNDRNGDTIAIECCIPDETGKFSDASYQTLLHLTAWLMGRYDLSIEDVIRHYDITGKDCPKYYVENPWAWEQLKEDICAYIEDHGSVE